MAVSTVFLDAGGVLVNPNWVRVEETLERHGVRLSSAVLAKAEPRVRARLDTPEEVRERDDQARGGRYFHLVLEEAGQPRTEETEAALRELSRYHAVHNLWESVPDGVVPALARLRRLGHRLVVVSNANGTVEALLERLELAKWFEAIVDSRREGVEKPDPRLFSIALSRSGADPRSTVHFGDLYHIDVVGARAAGLRGALVDPDRVHEGRALDCERFASLDAVADALEAGRW